MHSELPSNPEYPRLSRRRRRAAIILAALAFGIGGQAAYEGYKQITKSGGKTPVEHSKELNSTTEGAPGAQSKNRNVVSGLPEYLQMGDERAALDGVVKLPPSGQIGLGESAHQFKPADEKSDELAISVEPK